MKNTLIKMAAAFLDILRDIYQAEMDRIDAFYEEYR